MHNKCGEQKRLILSMNHSIHYEGPATGPPPNGMVLAAGGTAESG